MNTATLKPVVNTGLGNELEGVATFNLIQGQAAVNYCLYEFIHLGMGDHSEHVEREAISGLATVGKILSQVLANRAACGQLADGGAS